MRCIYGFLRPLPLADLPGDGDLDLVVHVDGGGGGGGGPGSGGASVLAPPPGGALAGVQDPQVEPQVIYFRLFLVSRFLIYDGILLGSVCTFRISDWFVSGSGAWSEAGLPASSPEAEARCPPGSS